MNDGMSCPEMYPEVSRLCNEKPRCVGRFSRAADASITCWSKERTVIATDVGPEKLARKLEGAAAAGEDAATVISPHPDQESLSRAPPSPSLMDAGRVKTPAAPT